MEEDLSSSVKIAVLDQKLEDLKNVVVRVDDAIQKISEVNINVSRMLAVHDERISKQEQTDIVLFSKIDKLRDKIDLDHDSIRARLSLLERRIWLTVGALGAVVVISNPQAIKMIKPLFSAAESAIISPVHAMFDGSR